MSTEKLEPDDPRLTAYAFGELSAVEKAALEAALVDDEAARAELHEIERTIDALRAELQDSAEPAPKLEPQRRQAVERAAKPAEPKARRRWLWGLSSAGTLAAGALLFSATLLERGRPVASQVAVPVATMAVASAAAPATAYGYDPQPASAPLVAVPSPSVQAGEWDDNANYREFMAWTAQAQAMGAHAIDIRDRRFIVVRDAAGHAVPNCRVSIDDGDRSVALKTMASGRAILFPHAEGLFGRELTASTACAGGARATFRLDRADGVVELRASSLRPTPQARTLDVAFILDSTGSMSEEIASVKSTLRKVAAGLLDSGQAVAINAGLVEYKDRGDQFVTRVYPMSGDLTAFSRQIADIQASGGGDPPESANEALHVALNELEWSESSFAKLAFLIADAPPHRDYDRDYDYVLEARDAAHRGIQLYTVAASGMDLLGQMVWRQLAQYTGGTNLFVLRGGAGPQSTGAGDPRSSCGGTQTSYTSGNLDELVLAKIRSALRAPDRDPLQIPGLYGDENAKPCAERVLVPQ